MSAFSVTSARRREKRLVKIKTGKREDKVAIRNQNRDISAQKEQAKQPLPARYQRHEQRWVSKFDTHSGALPGVSLSIPVVMRFDLHSFGDATWTSLIIFTSFSREAIEMWKFILATVSTHCCHLFFGLRHTPTSCPKNPQLRAHSDLLSIS